WWFVSRFARNKPPHPPTHPGENQRATVSGFPKRAPCVNFECLWRQKVISGFRCVVGRPDWAYNQITNRVVVRSLLERGIDGFSRDEFAGRSRQTHSTRFLPAKVCAMV